MRHALKPRNRLPYKQPVKTTTNASDGVTPIELVGWPGFRTQSGHSGDDPIESDR